MKFKILIVSVLIAALFSCNSAKNTQNTEEALLALTPPMGWNSFDSYGVYLHEKAAIENLRA